MRVAKLIALALASALVGCNALLGIEEHRVAVDAGACADAGCETDERDASGVDACAGSACAGAGMDGGRDAGETPAGDGGPDAEVDAETPPPDLCEPDPCADMPSGHCDPLTGQCVCGDCEQQALTRCSGDELSVCERQPNGCLEWTATFVCADGCGEGGTSCAGCSDQCTSGETVCDASALRRCVTDLEGCLAWGTAESCDDGVACTNDACDDSLGACDHAPDDSLCLANAGQMCIDDVCHLTLGCFSVNTSGACTDGDPCTHSDSCSDGLCAGELDVGMVGCVDLCPDDDAKSSPGQCGCGVEERTGDNDLDGTIDCLDACPDDECLALGLSCRPAQGRLSMCVADGAGCKTLEPEDCGARFRCETATPCPSIAFRGWGAGELVYPLTVAVDSAGNVFAGSVAYSDIEGQDGDASGHALITRFNASGVRQWSALWNSGSYGVLSSVALSPDETRIAGAITAGSHITVAVWSTAARGAPLWTRDVTPSTTGGATGVAYGPGGDVYVIGYVDGAIAGHTNLGSRDVLLARVQGDDGDLVWAEQFGTPGPEEVTAIVGDASGVYVTGMLDQISTSFNEHGDGFVRKYDATGEVAWHRSLDYGSDEGERLFSLSINEAGNVIAQGSSDWYEGPRIFIELSPSNAVVREAPQLDVYGARSDGRGNLYGQGHLDGYLVSIAGGTTRRWTFDMAETGSASVADFVVLQASSGPTRLYAIGGVYGQNEDGFLAIIDVP
jgi:hypothetical protein